MYLPRLAELETARQEWQELYDAASLEGADADFLKHEFRGLIIEATDANAATNDVRMTNIDRANQTLIVVLVVAGFCGVIYVLDQVL